MTSLEKRLLMISDVWATGCINMTECPKSSTGRLTKFTQKQSMYGDEDKNHRRRLLNNYYNEPDEVTSKG